MENILVAGANGTTKKIVDILNKSQYYNPIAMKRGATSLFQRPEHSNCFGRFRN
jgi:hypothetical protein